LAEQPFIAGAGSMQVDASSAMPVEPGGMAQGPRLALRQLVSAGSLRLVLEFADSREYVDQITAVTRIPGAPPWLLGIFSSEGAAVPLVDIAAWAQRSSPEPWTASQATLALPGLPQGGTKGGLRALRFNDGARAWAIRVSQAPSVFDPNAATMQPISTRLPLAVSSVNGNLMPHAECAWWLDRHSVALQVRWPEVYEVLLQELSGAGAAGAV
jgi:CheW-like domain